MKLAQNAVCANPAMQQKGSFFENKLHAVLKLLPILKAKQKTIPQNALAAEIKNIKEQMRNVQNRFDLCTDFDMTDACIYEMEALEARYRFLIKKAKREKIEQTPLYLMQKD